METPRECYELAEHCEEQAAMAASKRARAIFLELAVGWRRLGDAFNTEAAKKADTTVIVFRPRSSSRSSS